MNKKKNKDKNDVKHAKKYGIKEVGKFKFILNGEIVGESEEWKTCSIRCSSYEGKDRNG